MIRLRELKPADAPFMLEWMHDRDIQRWFKKDMLSSTLKQAEDFCINAAIPEELRSGQSIHYAIADEQDEYLGTVSLKEIDLDNLSAEYAIVLRKGAQGKGCGREATWQILEKAFNQYGLHRVYLNVYADNQAAIKLYESCGFVLEGEFREHLLREGNYINWRWYGMLKNEYNQNHHDLTGGCS